MQWWNDFLDWIQSDAGWKIISTAVIPFVAIIVAGIIGAAIGRGAIRRLTAQRDHEVRASAVASLIAAGQGAVTWHSQGPDAREHAEMLARQADVSVRLLPISGVGLAADWSSHELRDMRTNSVSYSYQAEQTLDEYRDRLVEWLHRPGRAKKLFAADLERWRYSETAVDPVVLEQQRWAEEQYTAVAHEPADHAREVPLTAPIPTDLPTAPPTTVPPVDEPAATGRS
jgi:type II secretory pathway pseudopilin PulG